MIHFHANFSKVKFGTMNDENENQENLNTKHNLYNSGRINYEKKLWKKKRIFSHNLTVLSKFRKIEDQV